MFIAPLSRGGEFVRRENRRAFTMLEIMLAVCILALMSVAIYRFVSANVIAMRLSSQANADNTRYTNLAALLSDQLQQLPPGDGTLGGEPYKFNGRSRDEMTWVCSAGPGLFTRYASGDYSVTLRLRPIPRSNLLELGVTREPAKDATNGTTDPSNQTWVPLIENLRSMEIRYFDPRLNAWVDRWTDRSILPHLVRLSLELDGATVPWQAIIPLRRTPM